MSQYQKILLALDSKLTGVIHANDETGQNSYLHYIRLTSCPQTWTVCLVVMILAECGRTWHTDWYRLSVVLGREPVF